MDSYKLVALIYSFAIKLNFYLYFFMVQEGEKLVSRRLLGARDI